MRSMFEKIYCHFLEIELIREEGTNKEYQNKEKHPAYH